MKTKEQKLQELCQEIYETFQRRIVPLYPWVLVRVLPKEQQVTGIWLPQTQNKTIYEGIVLQTWTPWMLKPRSLGMSTMIHVAHSSELVLGDRVIFPHAEGMPVPFLDEINYRLVREVVDQLKFPKLGILGKVEYGADKELRSRLDEMFQGVRAVTMSGA